MTTISYKIKDKKYYIPNDIKINGKIHITNKKKLDEMYDLLKGIDYLFVKNNIDYFITLGTLLGYQRHKGFIPWDDDIDICVFDYDIPKINKLMDTIKKQKKYNFKLTKGCPGYIFTKKKINKLSFVDIYILSQKGNYFLNGYPYKNKKPTFYTTEILFPKEIYNKENIKKIKRVKFMDFQVNVPIKTKKILFQLYSKNCLKECIIDKKKNTLHWIISKIRDKGVIFEKIGKPYYKIGTLFF